MGDVKLVKMFQVGDIKCALYHQDEHLGADVTVQGEEPALLEVQLLFRYELASLDVLLEEMIESERLNARLEGKKLVFSEKNPEESVELLNQLGITHAPRQREVATRDAETAIAVSQDSYQVMLAAYESQAQFLLKNKGHFSLSIKRPKFVFENGTMQVADGGSYRASFTSQDTLARELALVETEGVMRANMELRYEEAKRNLLINEHQSQANIQVELESARRTADFRLRETAATTRVQTQQVENATAVEALRAILQHETARNRADTEQELSRIRTALELQTSQIVKAKEEMRMEVERQVAQLQRESDLAEQRAKNETERYNHLLEQDQRTTQQELGAVEREKQDRARRKAEAERLARERAETLRRERERIQREARVREQQRLAKIEADRIRYKKELYAAEQRRLTKAREAEWERQQALQRQAQFQAQYEEQRRQMEAEQARQCQTHSSSSSGICSLL